MEFVNLIAPGVVEVAVVELALAAGVLVPVVGAGAKAGVAFGGRLLIGGVLPVVGRDRGHTLTNTCVAVGAVERRIALRAARPVFAELVLALAQVAPRLVPVRRVI